jgi:hypothetical protein
LELAGLSTEMIGHIPQADATGQLCCQQGDKLEPAGKRPKLLPDMVLIGKGLKFMSRKNPYNVRKNGAKKGRGSAPPYFDNVFGERIITSRSLRAFYFAITL